MGAKTALYPMPVFIIAAYDENGVANAMNAAWGGMMHCQDEMKKAVECGYWNMFRFDPSKETGKFTLDSKAPKDGYQDFLKNEARYSRLTREFPDRAEALFARNEAAAKERYEHLLKLVELYKD